MVILLLFGVMICFIYKGYFLFLIKLFIIVFKRFDSYYKEDDGDKVV